MNTLQKLILVLGLGGIIWLCLCPPMLEPWPRRRSYSYDPPKIGAETTWVFKGHEPIWNVYSDNPWHVDEWRVGLYLLAICAATAALIVVVPLLGLMVQWNNAANARASSMTPAKK